VQLVDIHPNPFAAVASIRYRVPEARSGDHVSLEIFDIRGRQVFELENLEMTPGEHQILWTGIDAYGRRVASGTYFVNVRSTYGVSSSKVTVIRSE
jgi:flagellar hook assembly protein FlgD